MIFCDICGTRFDSQDIECIKCSEYADGLNKFGYTKSNEEYQIEILKVQLGRYKI